MKSHYFRVLFILFFLFSLSAAAQSVGDYGSLQSGDWDDPNTWGVWDGSAYVYDGTYPGQTSGNYNVTISSGHTVVFDTNGAVYQSFDEIFVDGALEVNEDTELDVDVITLNSGGYMEWTSNNTNLKIPDGSSVILNGGELLTTNPCSNTKTLTVGSEVYASCVGGSTDNSFTDINNDGGVNVCTNNTVAPTWVTAAGALDETYECTANLTELPACTSGSLSQNYFSYGQYNWGFNIQNNSAAEVKYWSVKIPNANYTLDPTQLTNQSEFVYYDVDNGDGTFDLIFIGTSPLAAYSNIPSGINLTGTVDFGYAISSDALEILCSDTSSYTPPVATDDCGDVTVNLISDVFNSGAGTDSFIRVLTYQAVDEAGNLSSEFTKTITVQDNSSPTWVTPTGELDESYECASDVLQLSDCTGGLSVNYFNEAQYSWGFNLYNNSTSPLNWGFTISGANYQIDISQLTNQSAFIYSEINNGDGTYDLIFTGSSPIPANSGISGGGIGYSSVDFGFAISSTENSMQCADPDDFDMPVATDNCGTPTVNIISDVTTSGSGTDSYTRVITYQAEDRVGNLSTTFTKTITVSDTTAPVWVSAAGSLDESNECSIYAWDMADCISGKMTSYYFNENQGSWGFNVTNTTGSAISNWAIKISNADYQLDSALLSNNDKFIYAQKDNGDGTFDLLFTGTSSLAAWGGFDINLTGTVDFGYDPVSDGLAFLCEDAAVETVPVASDDCGSATVSVVSDVTTSSGGVETRVVTYQAVDRVGNLSSTFTKTITTTDSSAPVADLTTLPDLTGECGVTVTDIPTATDACEGTITGTTTDPLSYTTQGIYTITWNYEDGFGNSTTQTQTVIVADSENPTGTAPSDITVYCVSGIPAADPLEITDEADNCTVSPTVTHMGDSSDGLSNPETISRVYRIEDAAGNLTDVTQTILVYAIAVSTQPVDVDTFTGMDTTFSVAAVNADTFQWQVSEDGGVTFTDIDGVDNPSALTATLSLQNLRIELDGNIYRVKISNSASSCSEVLSDEATLTLSVETVITNRNKTYRVNIE